MEAVSESADPARSVHLNTVSTVDAAANVLRQLILDGELEPGSRLREAEFAERLGIARHSFRAATQVLISEGMLRREPHRGVQVTVLDATDILDTFRLRTALETEAVRIVIAEGRVPEGARQAVEDLSAVADRAPWRDVVEPDMRFHRAIIDAAGSPRLSRAYSGSRRRSSSAWCSCARTTSTRPRSPTSTRNCSRRSSRATRSSPTSFSPAPQRGGPEPE